MFGAFNQLFVTLGILFASLLQYIFQTTLLMENEYWFILFGFTFITILAQTFLLLTVFNF